MDIIRAILDGIMMAVYFNGLAAVFILINIFTYDPVSLTLILLSTSLSFLSFYPFHSFIFQSPKCDSRVQLMTKRPAVNVFI